MNVLGCALAAALDTPMFNKDRVFSNTDYLVAVFMETSDGRPAPLAA